MIPSLHQPSWLAQSTAQFTGLAILLLGALLVAYAAYLVLVGRWLLRDAKRRGHSGALWLTLFLVGSLPGVAIFGIIVLVVYLAVRSPTIKYDDQGHLYVPPRPPPGQPPVPTPPTWASAATPGTPAPLPTGQPLPTGLPAPHPQTPMQRVKCPYCLTIFPYQRALNGPTHVKCPACGQEGNI